MKQKVIISPSIMCSTPEDVEPFIREFEACGVDAIHFDVMDGHYVANVMLGVRDYQSIKKMSHLPVDIHLMCTEPEVFIDIFDPQPGDWVCFHPATSKHPYRLLQEIRRRGCRAGIAINPGDPIDIIGEMRSVLDYVLVMAINPGFAGQKMVPDHLDKLRRIRQEVDALGMHVDLIIDGNTTVENARKMLEAGATGLVTGTSSMLKGGPACFSDSYHTYMKSLEAAE